MKIKTVVDRMQVNEDKIRFSNRFYFMAWLSLGFVAFWVLYNYTDVSGWVGLIIGVLFMSSGASYSNIIRK